MQKETIFFDPSGKRKKIFTGVQTAAGLIIAVVTTFFAFTLLVIPFFPRVPGLYSGVQHEIKIPFPAIPQKKTRLSRFILHNSKAELWNDIKEEKLLKRNPHRFQKKYDKIIAAYYAPWEETGLNSLRANASKLTHLFTAWLLLNSKGTDIDSSNWNVQSTPLNLDVVRIAKNNNIKIIPLLSNSNGDFFDPGSVHNLLTSTTNQKKIISSISKWLIENKFNGIQIDFENLYSEDYQKLTGFLKLIRKNFKTKNLSLSATVEAQNNNIPVEDYAEQCSFLVLMAYDEHYETSDPGPISSIGWYNNIFNKALQNIPPKKLVMGIGNYSYDWTAKKKSAQAISYQSAVILARDYTSDINPEKNLLFDPDALNPYFNYADDQGNEHEVWMLDAVTAYNQCLIAKAKNIAGFAVWDLGSEDPSIWKFFNKSKIDSSFNPDSLETISFPYEIEFDGTGEFLSVQSTPQKGYRIIDVDSSNGLCTSVEYQKFPSSYLIHRTGFAPKELTITFDDGPSSEFTPKILDELKKLNVHATFFMIGENAEKNPSIVKRVYAEGNFIGNHTYTHPNIGAVSRRRALLEINTTQRVFESIIGRSTILFRPPYNADAEPASAEEVTPIIYATELGYITVGELIDPQDWNLFTTDENGKEVPRTVNDIVQSVYDQIKEIKGNVLLLHDGGGDRSNTVKALDIIVPELRKEGYKFVDISDLAGQTRDKLMPNLSPKDQLLVGLDKPVFEMLFLFEIILSYAFIAAIILGIARVIFITVLAIIKNSRNKKKIFDPDYKPFVSVIIAAYNEQKVISKTIESILKSNYKNLEIIVVDDGSSDGTYDEVKTKFNNEERIKLLFQTNKGKAAALNNAIQNSSGAILVSLDADTQMAEDAIPLLIRHFSDPKIGAVAGNVKVGNRINILTRWQTIEYVTSQNMDRQAYSLLNAITVVPGAIGAWRSIAVNTAGGYISDTLAEDMDLTWRLRKAGWKVDTENLALGFTEAPDTFKSFFKQRFRWSFGTLQCLWKHKSALFKYGWFGGLALPTLWIFQIIFQIIAPLVDIQIIYTIIMFLRAWISQGTYTHDWQPLPQTLQLLEQAGFFYVLLFLVEFVGAYIAFSYDKEKKKLLWWLFSQRFVYRQLMYSVIWKSIATSLSGKKQGWGKLQRKATVKASKEN